MLKLIVSALAFCALGVSAASNTTDFIIATSPYIINSKVHLYCFPVNVHFPKTAELCKALVDVDEEFDGLDPVECDDEDYDEPVKFWIRGLLNGEEVKYERQYDNHCEAKKHLGLIAEGILTVVEEETKEPVAEKTEPEAEKKEPVVEKKEPVAEKKGSVEEKKNYFKYKRFAL